MKQNTHNDNWYRLDTSATIYPAIESISNPSIYRIAVSLKKNVNENILLQALEDIRHRFPYFNVQLKKGLFWNYLQKNNNKLLIWPDTPSPCERIYRNINNGFLYKVKYYKKNIIVEFFHILTDGFGSMEFLKCLINRYLFLTGEVRENVDGIFNIHEKPDAQEYEDAFLRVSEDNNDKAKFKLSKTLVSNNSIYQINDKILPNGVYKVITGIITINDMKKISKNLECTVTQLISALYIEAMIHYQALQIKNKSHHKNIALQIPVDLRKYYPCKCMRNFSLYVIPQIDPRKVNDFKSIVNEIKNFMKEHLTHENLLTNIKDNCSLVKNKFIKSVPVDLKNLVIGYLNNTRGATQFSGIISNLGMIKLPDEISKHIEDIQAMNGAKPKVKCTCCVLGYNDKIYITFGRTVKSTYIERHVFTRLVKMGAKVKIKSTS